MNIFNRRRRQKKKEKNIFNDETDVRVQFNSVIAKDIKSAIQEMAKKFRLNQSVLTEHLLQVALYYTSIAIKDEEKQKIIEKHLIDGHLLRKYVDDEEVIIRIVEPNQNWMLLSQAKKVAAFYIRFKHAMVVAERTGSMDYLDKCKRDLDVAVLRFAEWIYRYRLNDSGELSSELKKEDE